MNQTSLIKILDINVQFIRKAARDNFVDELNDEIKGKLARLDDVEGLPYAKSDMVRLIRSIETKKMRCLKGEISAIQLYHDVQRALSLFKTKHAGFDYTTDPIMIAYFS